MALVVKCMSLLSGHGPGFATRICKLLFSVGIVPTLVAALHEKTLSNIVKLINSLLQKGLSPTQASSSSS